MEPVKYGSWSFLQKNLRLKAENNFAKSSIFDVLKDLNNSNTHFDESCSPNY